MDSLLEKIIHSPKLPIYFKEIQNLLEEEQQKRQRFYEEMTEQEKAEFIEGKIVVHSPVKKWHNETCGNIYSLIKLHNQIYQLGFVGFEKILVRFTRNDYEPDICFFKKEKSTGFTDGQMFFPAPNFVAEILSESTEKHDRAIKFEDYALHGVEEYWLVHPEEKYVEQYFLKEGRITSTAIKDFSIPIQAIFEEKENLKTLQGF